MRSSEDRVTAGDVEYYATTGRVTPLVIIDRTGA